MKNLFQKICVQRKLNFAIIIKAQKIKNNPFYDIVALLSQSTFFNKDCHSCDCNDGQAKTIKRR